MPLQREIAAWRPNRNGPKAGRRFCDFRRASDGAAAVEFAIVAMPFFALIGGILETSVAFWAQANLEQAVSDASRAIYTGQFQTANSSTKDTPSLLNAFRALICTDGTQTRTTLFNCNNVRVNITVADNFTGANFANPIKVDPTTGMSDWNPSFGSSYSCAKSSSVVLVQAAVDYPVFFSILNLSAVTLPGGKRVLQAAAVFRAEPYNSGSAC